MSLHVPATGPPRHTTSTARKRAPAERSGHTVLLDCDYRYFVRHADEIDPGPQPDARHIAERVAGVAQRAFQTGQPQSVMLHTVRLAADLWRRYAIRFDAARGEIAVRVGPVVTTSGRPLPARTPSSPDAVPVSEAGPSSPRERLPTEARVQAGLPLAPTPDDEYQIDAFSGPSFSFERRGAQLHVQFLPWHRRWSHSLTLALALGLAAAALAALPGLFEPAAVTRAPLWAGLVVFLGLLAHTMEDQLGHLGSNLLYPFTRERSRGLGLLHSGDAVPNVLTVWISLALILLNLDRFSGQPTLNSWWFLALAVVLPAVALGTLYRQRHEGPATAETLQQRDIVSEMPEPQFE